MVTGGLGGLGTKVVDWMIERGARRILVLTRKPREAVRVVDAAGEIAGDRAGEISADRARARLLEGWSRLGANVRVVGIDLADLAELQRTLTEHERSLGAIRGVVHAAGILDDGALVQQTWDRFARVLSPKILGAWNLHVATERRHLDFFVLFSSSASLIGTSGQSNYAAGNGFLDALAHHRRAEGLPAMSINWGPWSEVGMAARASRGNAEHWALGGAGAIRPELGVQVLERLLADPPIQVGILPFQWLIVAQQTPTLKGLPLLARQISEMMHPRRRATDRDDILERLRGAQPKARQGILSGYLESAVLHTLGMSPTDKLDRRRGFKDLGLDSLVSVQLRNELQTSLRRFLPHTITFNYPNIDALAAHLVTQLFPPEAAAKPAHVLAPTLGADDPARAAERELEAQFEEELATLEMLVQREFRTS